MDQIIANILFSVVGCEFVSFIGCIFYSKQLEPWHDLLKKPIFYPPGWLIFPLKTFLFLLMGLGLSQILNIGFDSPDVLIALIIFGVMMIVGVFWAFMFFGIRKFGYALLILLVLIMIIITNIVLFYLISPMASYFLVPYLFWMLYTAVVNLSIHVMNLPE